MENKQIPNNYIIKSNLEAFYRNCPPHFKDVTMDSCKKFHSDEIIDSLQGWLHNPKQSLIFLGNPGSGKTCLCYAMIRSLIEKGQCHSGEFTFSTAAKIDTSLLQAIKSDEGDVFLVKKYKEQQILIIDDFGRENTSERTNRQFFDIIDDRMAWHRPTIISTNLSLSDLAKRYDPALISRFKLWMTFSFEGKDLREGGYKL